mgnify:CR=1 FL=1
MLPMHVAMYLYFVTLMLAASAVFGFSPTARRCRPVRVCFMNQATKKPMAIARYTMKP